MCENVIWKIKIKFSNCEEILHPGWRERERERHSRFELRVEFRFEVGVPCAVRLALNAFALIMLGASMPISAQPSIGRTEGRSATVGVARVCTTHSNMANTNYWFFCKCTRNEANSLIKMKWNDACESQYKLRRPQTTDGCLFPAALANGSHYDVQYTIGIYK